MKIKKKSWRIIRIFIGIFLLVVLGASVIFDIIFYITKWYPHLILRVIIVYLLLEILLRFTWFGKEFESFIKNKLKKKKQIKKNETKT